MKRLLSIVVLSLSLALAGAVQATTLTGTLSVSGTVQAVCTATTAAVNFGSMASGNYTANGGVSVTCTTGAPYHIALDAGQHWNSNARNISNGGTVLLGYNLCKDSTCNYLWGDSDYADTFPQGSSLADTGDGSSQAHTVYGGGLNVPPGVPAGTYTDSVNVTVYY